MDKSWIDDDARHGKAYLQGVNRFLAFAFSNAAVGSKILCPCRKCSNSFWYEASEVQEHLICDGFLKGYRTWNLHGELTPSVNHENLVPICAAPPFQQPHRSSSSPFVQPNTFPTASYMQRPHSSPIPTTRVVQPPRTSPIPTDSVVHSPQSSPDGAGPLRNGDANHVSHDDLIGKEIILYALQRDEPVAKGTVISVNPRCIHAGQALGKKHCLVVIRFVIKRDAKLPRPYPGVEEMAGAKDLSIAWPYKRLKVCKPKNQSHGTGAGRK